MRALQNIGNARALRGTRFSVLHSVLDSRLGHSYLLRRKGYESRVVGPGTDVVVDGFPRSANTYVWHALRTTLEPAREVRGHTHAADTVREAVRRDIPTILLIRNPDAAVASLVQLADGVSLSRAFDAYIQFYKGCHSSADGAMFVDFSAATSNLPVVLDQFYKHFGLDWPPYEGTQADEDAIMDAIDEESRQRRGGVVREAGVARPSAHRRPSTEVLARLSRREQRARDQAQEVYCQIMESQNVRRA